MGVGKRFKFLRESLELSQRKFCKELGISPSRLSDIENGNFKPSVETVLSVSNYCGVSTDWLIKGEKSEGEDHFSINELSKELLKQINSLLMKKTLSIEEIAILINELNPSDKREICTLLLLKCQREKVS